MPTIKQIPCPRCKSLSNWSGNPYRPFCSERCQGIDLGNWAAEKYRVAGDNADEEEDGVPNVKNLPQNDD